MFILRRCLHRPIVQNISDVRSDDIITPICKNDSPNNISTDMDNNVSSAEYSNNEICGPIMDHHEYIPPIVDIQLDRLPSIVSRQSNGWDNEMLRADDDNDDDHEVSAANEELRHDTQDAASTDNISHILNPLDFIKYLKKLEYPLVKDPFTLENFISFLHRTFQIFQQTYEKLLLIQSKFMLEHLSIVEDLMCRIFPHWDSHAWTSVIADFRKSYIYEHYCTNIQYYEQAINSLNLHSYTTNNFSYPGLNSDGDFHEMIDTIDRQTKEKASHHFKVFSHLKRTSSSALPCRNYKQPGKDEGRTINYECSHSYNQEGRLCIRVIANMKFPPIRVAAILCQVEEFNRWVPYCEISQYHYRFRPGHMLVRQVNHYPWPIRDKETISYCFGMDFLDEYGAFFIAAIALPLTYRNFLGIDIPPPQEYPQRLGGSTVLFIFKRGQDDASTYFEMHCVVDLKLDALRTVLAPIIQRIVNATVKEFFKKFENVARHYDTNGMDAFFKADPEAEEWFANRFSNRQKSKS